MLTGVVPCCALRSWSIGIRVEPTHFRLDPLLRLSLTQAEADAFDSGEISTKEWLAQARGGARRGALAWLAHPRGRERPPAGAPDDAVVRLLYESLEIPIRWRLSASRATSGNADQARCAERVQ